MIFLLVLLTPPQAEQIFVEPHMGTRCKLVFYCPDKSSAERAAKAAFARIAALDKLLSDYKPDSELNRLCKQSGGPPTRVSPELFTVLEQAERVSRISQGSFDVSIGPVVRLWRQARRTQLLPDFQMLAAARAKVGYKLIELIAKDQSVRLAKPGMQLDLGGIAKGYAADEALLVLRNLGVTSALVAMGGDIAVSEPPPGQSGWRVGIAQMDNPNDPPRLYVLLKNQAISTSGDAEQHVEIAGSRYSHIVDPRTGIGLTGQRSVSIIAPRGIQADSLSKVASVLEPAESLPILERIPEVHVRIVRRIAGKESEHTTSGFLNHVAK